MKFREVFKKASYISPSNATCTAPFMFDSITKDESMSSCEICVIGYGICEVYVNGKKVSDDIFAPATSDYHTRDNNNYHKIIYDNEATKRSYFLKYDLTPYLVSGLNRLAILVGKGWYCIDSNHDEGCLPYGDEKLCYEVTKKDKDGSESIIAYSSEKTKWVQSHILENDLFYGEKQDLNIFDFSTLLPEYDISSFETCTLASVPETNYTLQDFPSDKVIRTIKPRLLKDFGTYKVYDNGENVTGYVKLKCDKKGEYIKLVHTEEIDSDGNVDGTSIAIERKKQCDEYISDGKSELVPHFTFHGFRYFSLEGDATPIETLVVHTDVEVDSSFTSSDETLNWLYDACVRTYLDNLHGCVPSDCPTREKLGYTGDGQLCCEMGMHIADTEKAYLKWLCDIVDSQDNNTGHVPHTAPYQGGGGGLGWGTAMVEVPYMLWKYYGNEEVLEKYFPNMMRWMAYMDSRSEAGFITSEEQGWVLGDWGFPYEPENYQLLCPNYVNTYFYVKNLLRMEEIASKLGHPKYAKMCRDKAEQSKRAMRSAYMSPMNNCFYNDFSAGNSFAIDLGIGTEKTLAETVKKYDSLAGFDCGIFALDILVRVLFETGNAKTAYKLLTSHKDKASFGYMMDNGATTVWEYMNGEKSHNHPMFAACVSTFFKYILGIRQTENSYGFSEVVISPTLIGVLEKAKGHITTPNGKICVDIDKNKVVVDIPNGVCASFCACGKETPLSVGRNTIEL